MSALELHVFLIESYSPA